MNPTMDYQIMVRFGVDSPPKTFTVCGHGLRNAISHCWQRLTPYEFRKVTGFTPLHIEVCEHAAHPDHLSPNATR